MKIDRLRIALQNNILWGVHGDRYTFDNRTVQFSGNGLRESVNALAELVADLSFDAIACCGVGGLPLASALKLVLPERINVLFIRRERKGYELNRLVEGPELPPFSRVLIVDDLLNAGSSFNRVADAVVERFPSATIIGIAVLVDFEQQGSKQLRARGFEVRRVFTARDLNLKSRPFTSGHFRRIWQNLAINTTATGYVRSVPAVAGDNLIVGTDYTGWVCCDKRDGELLWTIRSCRPVPNGVASTPQVFDSDVVLAAYDGVIRRVQLETAEVVWQNKIDSFIHSTPQIHDSLIFVGTEGRKRKGHYGDIVCLNAESGLERWRIKTRDQVPCTPLVIAEKEMVVCASNDKMLYCADFAGELKWQVNTNHEIKGCPVYAENAVFTAANEGFLESWTCDGKLIWSRKLCSSLHLVQPVIYKNKIIVPLSESGVAALDKDTGDVIWYNAQKSRPAPSITIQNDAGFIITRNGILSKLNLDTGVTEWSEQVVENCRVGQPVVIDMSRIYITTDNAGIVAIELEQEN